MFKFAIDKSRLFQGDDHKASRIAGHDLLGFNCFVASAVEELNTPLVCLIDYRGFRLIAMSLLPIDRESLVYGSDDAGIRISTDPIAHEALMKASRFMNTAEHTVVELRTLERKTLATALDVEVHRSPVDGKLYVVDCSRVMPASAVCRDPAYKGPCNHLTMLLRPEIVSTFPRPLCNDVFSSFLFPRAIIMRAIQHKKLMQCDQNESESSRQHRPVSVSAYEETAPPGSFGSYYEPDGEINDFTQDTDGSSSGRAPKATPSPSSSERNKPISAAEHKVRAYWASYDDQPPTIGYEIDFEDSNSASYDAHPGSDSHSDHEQKDSKEKKEEVTVGDDRKEDAESRYESGNFSPSGTPPVPAESSSSSSYCGRADLGKSVFQEEIAAYTALLAELDDQRKRFEEDIVSATARLVSHTIPKFGETLKKIFRELPTVQQSVCAYDWMVVLLHWHGINIRHLGAVRAYLAPKNDENTSSSSGTAQQEDEEVCSALRSLLLNIMVSRVLKNMSNHRLRMKMRELCYAGEYPYQRCLVSLINLVFGTSSESLVFWNLHVKNALLYQFPDALSEEEKNADLKTLVLENAFLTTSNFSLFPSSPIPLSQRPPMLKKHSNSAGLGPHGKSPRESPIHTPLGSSSNLGPKIHTSSSPDLLASSSDPKLSTSTSSTASTGSKSSTREAYLARFLEEMPMEPICFLFFSFCRLIGLKFKSGHMRSFASNPALFQVAEPVHVLDLDGAPEKVKTLQVVSLAEGQVWKVRAEAASSLPKSQQFAFDLWKLALESYKQSLLANPRDQRTLRNAAEVYHAMGLLQLAGTLAYLAIETNPDDSVSLYKYATYLWSSTGNHERAKRYFEAAIRAPNATPGAILAYAAFEIQRNNTNEAITLVERCLEKFPNSWDAHFKMANMLQYQIKDYEKAAKHYRIAMEMENEDIVLLRHFVCVLGKIEPVDTDLIATYELFIKKLEQKANISGHRTKSFYSALISPSLRTSQSYAISKAAEFVPGTPPSLLTDSEPSTS